ncbi:MAG: hypothetical protein QOD33_1818 [Pyrinomonadaceae bacterium]|jgi:hypothetical protein|nr:hypothetical protein [Pyrinomonadaceae bacterium]
MQAGGLLVAVQLALRFVTVGRLQQVCARRKRAGMDDILAPDIIARLVRVAAERGPCRARCLPQSLVLHWLLQRRGVASRIVFGARKADEQMQAHAWVEVNGVTLSQDHGVYRDFSPLDELVRGS